MKSMIRAAALALALVPATAALAQADYPNRRVTLVVSAATGGGLDPVARMLAKRMQETWGQPAIVENQGGAEGLIATQRVINAPADGYTMLLTIPSMLLLKHNVRDLSVDPVAALTPVSKLGSAFTVLSVNSKLGVGSFKELVAYCNKTPKPCTWGSGQHMSYLFGQMAFDLAGVKETLNVPHKGTGPVITALLGGHVDIGMSSVAAPLGHHQKGTLKVLAVNAPQRVAQLPDVPTFRELGLDFPGNDGWYGLFVPRNTPAAVVAKIEKVATSLAGDPAAQELLRGLGAEPVFGPAREFARDVQESAKHLDGLVQKYPFR
jgi:tripartite-type tricarboxylate transporter receptor subunit TctC